MKTGDHVHDTAPALVSRCRGLIDKSSPGVRAVAHQCGVIESIYLPSERKAP